MARFVAADGARGYQDEVPSGLVRLRMTSASFQKVDLKLLNSVM
ncbi:MAG TPA: hypothetical protein VFG46_06680 [Chryseolinea sp.]|nr:hypothetical protein [Chryseolinea sp.]